jgi:hypothetical protein
VAAVPSGLSLTLIIIIIIIISHYLAEVRVNDIYRCFLHLAGNTLNLHQSIISRLMLYIEIVAVYLRLIRNA